MYETAHALYTFADKSKEFLLSIHLAVILVGLSQFYVKSNGRLVIALLISLPHASSTSGNRAKLEWETFSRMDGGYWRVYDFPSPCFSVGTSRSRLAMACELHNCRCMQTVVLRCRAWTGLRVTPEVCLHEPTRGSMVSDSIRTFV